jgi:hypothetical protein
MDKMAFTQQEAQKSRSQLPKYQFFHYIYAPNPKQAFLELNIQQFHSG